MYELALFSGAGGGILGGKMCGWRTIGAVESAQYPRETLIKNQERGSLEFFPIWDDIKTFRLDNEQTTSFFELLRRHRRNLIISGGFPCQPFSTAAAGKNNAEDLWPEMLRVIEEIKPRFVFCENVQRRPIEKASKDLTRVGFRSLYTKLSSKDVGGFHRRNRWWLLGDSDVRREPESENNDEAQILQSVCRSLRSWKNRPTEIGMVDGVADRLDRIKAIGNGQDPYVACEAYKFLKNVLEK